MSKNPSNNNNKASPGSSNEVWQKMTMVELGHKIGWSISANDLYRFLKRAEAMGLAKEPVHYNFADIRWSFEPELFTQIEAAKNGLFGFLFGGGFNQYSTRR